MDTAKQAPCEGTVVSFAGPLALTADTSHQLQAVAATHNSLFGKDAQRFDGRVNCSKPDDV